MDRVESDWKDVNMENATDKEIIEFMRLNCTFSIDVNTKDPRTINWIYNNKHLIKTGKE